jgi:hypothetical protein
VFITFTGAVELGLGKLHGDIPSSNDKSDQLGPWILTLNLFYILGIGSVKLSATFYLLRIFEARYCGYLLGGIIGKLHL